MTIEAESADKNTESVTCGCCKGTGLSAEHVKCKDCRGFGFISPRSVSCEHCNGTGFLKAHVTCNFCGGFGNLPLRQICPRDVSISFFPSYIIDDRSNAILSDR